MKRFFPFLSIVIFLFSFVPNIFAQGTQTVTSGGQTTPINFPGTGCVYRWVNNSPGIGLAAAGIGNIPSFTAINNGNQAITGLITATPSPSGFAYIPNRNDNSVSVINTSTNKVISLIPVGSNPIGVAVSPDGSRVYVANNASGNVSVINTISNAVIAIVTVGLGPCGLSVSPDGSAVYVANNDAASVSVINTVTNSVSATIKVDLLPYDIAISKDGSTVYAGAYQNDVIDVINTKTNTVTSTYPSGSYPVGMAISPDGTRLYEADRVGAKVRTISTATNTLISSVAVGARPYAIAVSPDGNTLYVTDEVSNDVFVINAASNAVIATILVGTTPQGVSISADGALVYVANSASNNISVISTATNTIVSTIPVGSSPVALGNFVAQGIGCAGGPLNFSIIVKPAPALPAAISVNLTAGSISACEGSASSSPNLEYFTVSGANLTADITAIAPANFEISFSVNSGFANSLTLKQTGGTVNNTVIYVRSAASAPAGSVSGFVPLSSVGASTVSPFVSAVISALPLANPVANESFTAGDVTAPINFTGTANSYTWVNNTPGIGLTANGSGNIPAFTAVNAGTTPLTATVTVTPKMAALAYVPNNASNNISVINTATNQVTDTISVGSFPFGAAVSPDQSTVYVTNQQANTISVIKTATNTVVATIPVGAHPGGLVVSPDGHTLYVANAFGASLTVINTATNLVTGTDTLGSQPYGAAVTPDGSTIYVANVSTLNVSVINTANNKTIATINVDKDPTGLAITPDGTKVYVANQGTNTISVISTSTNTVTGSIAVGAPYSLQDFGDEPTGLAFSPGGSRLYITDFGKNTVSVLNTANSKIIATIAVGLEPYGVSVNADGTRVYVANRTSNNVSVINTATNTVIATIPVGTTPYAFGNFIAEYAGCTGAPITFTITVKPNTSPVITAGAVTGSISACQGTPSASPNIEKFPVSGVRLTGDIVAAAPAGFEVSLTPTDGYAGSVTLSQAGGSVSNAIVYVRSTASASPLNITGSVMLSSAGATSQNVLVSGIVNPLAVVNPVPDQVIANGAATTAVNFTGTASTFSWVNDTPGIGLAASGAGNIASFVAVNKGNVPVTATITVTPSGSQLAYITNNGDGTVSVINTSTNKVVNTIKSGFGSFITYVAASPDGSLVYIVNEFSSSVAVVSTALNSVIATIPVGSYPEGIIVSPDGSRVYVANNGSDNISVIDALSNTVISVIPVGSNPAGLALTPDGNSLYVTYSQDDFVISVVNTQSETVTATIPVGYFDAGIHAAPDGSEVWVTNGSTDIVSAINTATNSIVFNIPLSASLGFGFYGLTMSPDGQRLYALNDYDNDVAVIDARSGSILATINVGKGPEGISVSADSKQVYVANNTDNTVSVIDAATNKITATIPVGNSPVALGNFISAGPGCFGLPVTFTITVNPGMPVITSAPVTIPNTFTPNGDGVNDKWNIKNISGFPNCTVQVYNRWGQNVYYSTGYEIPWDGTYRESALPTGTYYYIVDLKNGLHPLSGFVSIIH